jgi:hypothetical protein
MTRGHGYFFISATRQFGGTHVYKYESKGWRLSRNCPHGRRAGRMWPQLTGWSQDLEPRLWRCVAREYGPSRTESATALRRSAGHPAGPAWATYTPTCRAIKCTIAAVDGRHVTLNAHPVRKQWGIQSTQQPGENPPRLRVKGGAVAETPNVNSSTPPDVQELEKDRDCGATSMSLAGLGAGVGSRLGG